MKEGILTKINKAHSMAKLILEISVVILCALGLSTLLIPLLGRLGINITGFSWYPILAMGYKYLAAIWGIILILALCCVLLLSIWVKEDETVKQNETKETTLPKCPLINITPIQQQRIEDLLRSISPNPKNKKQIKLSVVTDYLRALMEDGKIKPFREMDPTEQDNLRRWVKEVTKKEVPNKSQFNESLGRNNITRFYKSAQETIKKILA